MASLHPDDVVKPKGWKELLKELGMEGLPLEAKVEVVKGPEVEGGIVAKGMAHSLAEIVRKSQEWVESEEEEAL